MIQRAFLAVLLIAAAVGFAYVIGRARTDKAATAEAPPPAKLPSPDQSSRARVREPSVPDPPPLAVAPNAGSAPSQAPRVQTAEPPAAPPSPSLMERGIGLPLAELKSSDIVDTFDHPRGGGERRHEAVDIVAPRGTPVLAATSGPIAKLFKSDAGGLTIYQFDANEKHCFYYAHLDRYAEGLREGLLVKQGTVIGYVGSTGNADPSNPHLHFAVFELGPEKLWYSGTTPINPYPLLMDALKR